ncbi:hypothetical protein HCN44_002919 [Aphidius gifuensis]|uniref:J domain-containing protein n=1 Tax=Aphidius gifuensis TaxID=684658 RepID=A0A834XTJ9_APHGI|nr:hypothetical protein HCN44_002919 [Aphidius gifuensis]
MLKNMFDKLIIFRIFKTQKCNYYSTKSYYDVLGIKEDASKKDIRLAFLKLSKQMHPDTSNKKDHDEFVKITQAYNILSKEESKKNYDLNLQQQDSNPYYTTFRQPHQQQQQQQQQYTFVYLIIHFS